MSTELPTFQRKQKLLATQLQALSDAVRANRILPGFGIRVTGSPNGTTIAVRTKAGVPSHADTHPFQIYLSPFEGEGQPPADQPRRVRVRHGTAMGHVPSNIMEEFVIPASVSWRALYLEVALTWSASPYHVVGDVTIKVGTMPPPEQNPLPSKVYYTIGWVSTNDKEVTLIFNNLKTSIDGSATVIYWTCSEQYRQWTWHVPGQQYW